MDADDPDGEGLRRPPPDRDHAVEAHGHRRGPRRQAGRRTPSRRPTTGRRQPGRRPLGRHPGAVADPAGGVHDRGPGPPVGARRAQVPRRPDRRREARARSRRRRPPPTTPTSTDPDGTAPRHRLRRVGATTVTDLEPPARLPDRGRPAEVGDCAPRPRPTARGARTRPNIPGTSRSGRSSSRAGCAASAPIPTGWSAMLLLHDLVQIDSGTTIRCIWPATDGAIAAAEPRAAAACSASCPPADDAAFAALWREFEAGDTAEAAAARAIDIAQPLFQELYRPTARADRPRRPRGRPDHRPGRRARRRLARASMHHATSLLAGDAPRRVPPTSTAGCAFWSRRTGSRRCCAARPSATARGARTRRNIPGTSRCLR